MRAVIVSEYGGTPAVGEIPTPEPAAGQVLLRMRAAGMNPMDATLASGASRPAPATFPMVLGADGAGVVERAGEAARRFSRGDELFGQLLIPPLGSAGTYAEYVADPDALAAAGVTGDNFNFAQDVSGELLEQVADALVSGRIAAPPITRITLEQAPAALNPAQAGRTDGKTVITL